MDTYDYFKENFRDKLDALLEERYPNESRQQARRNKFVEDYTKRFEPAGSFKSTLNNWIYRKSVPELRTLLNICELLNAEPDYFLIASQAEFRKGAQSASELLQLPEYVTNAMVQYKAQAKNLLIDLVEDERGDRLEQLLNMILECTSNSRNYEFEIKSDGKNYNLSRFESFEIVKQITADKFKRLLDDVWIGHKVH